MCPFAQMIMLELSVPEYLHPLSDAGIYILSVTERVQRNLDSICVLRPLKSLSRSNIAHFLRVICACTTHETNSALVGEQVSTVLVQADVCLGIPMNSDDVCIVSHLWSCSGNLGLV